MKWNEKKKKKKAFLTCFGFVFYQSHHSETSRSSFFPPLSSVWPEVVNLVRRRRRRNSFTCHISTSDLHPPHLCFGVEGNIVISYPLLFPAPLILSSAACDGRMFTSKSWFFFLHCHYYRNYIVHLICCLSTKSICHVAMSVSSFPSWHPPSSRGQACSGRALSSGSTKLSRPSIDSCWLFLSSLSEAASPSDSSRATIEVLRLLCLHAGVEAASVARGREGAI